MEFQARLKEIINQRYQTTLDHCTKSQVYHALLQLTQELCAQRSAPISHRKLYYFSAEFLVGKLLSNHLLALGLFQPVSQLLEDHGFHLAEIEEQEPEPSLGNGGLGRLAACFLDSLAALGLPGDGVGLNYHYGLFHQYLRNNKQEECADPWIQEDGWLIPTNVTFPVHFGNQTVNAVMWDMSVPGANNTIANRLHLFDVEHPAPAPAGGIHFDKGDISHQLTSFLYPDDSDETGRLLRVYQQYFMVSAGAQLIMKELDERGISPWQLCEHVAIQINDTHPSMILPELTRLLLERGLSMNDALHQVAHACAYTNHTILAEALEKWPMSYIQQVAPQLVPIIREMDRRAKSVFPDPRMAMIDNNDTVHMAHMDIHYTYSTNGVAALHTDILRNSELKHFADVYSYKFNNKTNGVTFRRWLQVCNLKLAALIDQCIGAQWRQDPGKLEQLMSFLHNEEVLQSMLNVKKENKKLLAKALKERQNVEVDPDSIFDIQVKRLHEYKRQQMNALYIIRKYLDIKNGQLPSRPITVLFGAKAAPAYVMAKHIIHLILCLRQLIESDPQVRPWLRVVMVENYNVSWAEKLIPACDISEQISLASKEASGTGNMKFMANGAITLGTMDGANVEISQLVGPDNIYTFGAASDRVIQMYANHSYHPQDFYHRPWVREIVDFIVSPALMSVGDETSLRTLWNDIQNKDWFMALLDLEEYIAVRNRMYHDYEDRTSWARKMLVNTAKSGYFSSDRTIAQYNQDIWHLN